MPCLASTGPQRPRCRAALRSAPDSPVLFIDRTTPDAPSLMSLSVAAKRFRRSNFGYRTRGRPISLTGTSSRCSVTNLLSLLIIEPGLLPYPLLRCCPSRRDICDRIAERPTRARHSPRPLLQPTQRVSAVIRHTSACEPAFFLAFCLARCTRCAHENTASSAAASMSHPC
jgi:hypothetical protein